MISRVGNYQATVFSKTKEMKAKVMYYKQVFPLQLWSHLTKLTDDLLSLAGISAVTGLILLQIQLPKSSAAPWGETLPAITAPLARSSSSSPCQPLIKSLSWSWHAELQPLCLLISLDFLKLSDAWLADTNSKLVLEFCAKRNYMLISGSHRTSREQAPDSVPYYLRKGRI